MEHELFIIHGHEFFIIHGHETELEETSHVTTKRRKISLSLVTQEELNIHNEFFNK